MSRLFMKNELVLFPTPWGRERGAVKSGPHAPNNYAPFRHYVIHIKTGRIFFIKVGAARRIQRDLFTARHKG